MYKQKTANNNNSLPPIHAAIQNHNPVTFAAEQELHLPSLLDNNSAPSPNSLPPIQIPNSTNDSRMSINRLVNDAAEPADDVLGAAQVLETLRRGPVDAPAPVEPSPVPNSSNTNVGLRHRLPAIPLVNRALGLYEQGKEKSSIFKTSADALESSFKAISTKIPQIEQLDEYACRGLDKLEERFPGVIEPTNNSRQTGGFNGIGDDNMQVSIPTPQNHHQHLDISMKRQSRGNSELSSRSSSPSYRNSGARPHRTSQSNVLVGTGTVVGGVGAAVSEESMKSLKYCLQWLHYANQHIEHQIAVLREFIVNLTKQASSSSSGALINTSATSTLSSIKREVVETLRKVIEVVSKYAGACLPDQARTKVRTFILNLPSKWANINRTGDHSATPSPMSSPVLAPTTTNTHPATNAIRLLSLATESLEMLEAVAKIFSDTIASAESWVARLRAVGVTSGGAAAVGELQFDNIPQLPTGCSSQQQNGYYKSNITTPVTTNGINDYNRKHSNIDDDDDLTINDDYEYSSSESEAEDMRMQMNSQNGIFATNKRPKKSMKKDDDESMDLS
ncbi:5958_t:CDS:2 [Ambispora gerdemannii]|uniref:5958_t:CDS:1 n=1 Tax=Ambispora gerdemannii TaxID=144530 RepID=A0A9N9GZN6_9GLOM|nr:5958_t:CDS:2 [Ambispora gerdemannii]